MGEGAARTPGKRSLAMEAFATALRSIPATICDNAGDAHTPVNLLSSQHHSVTDLISGEVAVTGSAIFCSAAEDLESLNLLQQEP